MYYVFISFMSRRKKRTQIKSDKFYHIKLYCVYRQIMTRNFRKRWSTNLNSQNTKNPTTYDAGNPGPGLGQTQQDEV